MASTSAGVAGSTASTIPILCRALREVDYKTCRISYETIPATLSRHLLKRVVRKPTSAQWIEGTLCFQVNGSGFSEESMEVVKKATEAKEFAVIFAHPHSLIASNDQNIKYLKNFLDSVSDLREDGKLAITTPGEVYSDRTRTSL